MTKMLPSRAKTTAIVMLLLLCACGAMAQSSATMTWSAYVVDSLPYEVPQPNARVISQFTPASSVTALRLEGHAGSGPYNLETQGYCMQNPKLLVTNGKVGFAVTIPNSQQPVQNVSFDSGPLSVGFAAGIPVRLIWVAGKGDSNGNTCFLGSMNTTLQYTSP